MKESVIASKFSASANTGLLAVALVLYIFSFATPAYQPILDGIPRENYYGWLAFITGPAGLFAGHYSWLANPVILVGWLQAYKGNVKDAFFLFGISLLIALTFLLNKDIPVGSSGAYAYKIKFGYWLWIVSMGMTCIATLKIWLCTIKTAK